MELISIYNEIREQGASHWDALRANSAAWRRLNYHWLGESCYGDQIAKVTGTPLPNGEGKVYILGPDIAGPIGQPNWPEDLMCIAASCEQFLERIQKYGDEFSVAPGCIERELSDEKMREEYKQHYRFLNPGLKW